MSDTNLLYSTQSNNGTELANQVPSSSGEDPLSAFAHALSSGPTEGEPVNSENFTSPADYAEGSPNFSSIPEYGTTPEANPQTQTLRDLQNAVTHDVYSQQAERDRVAYQRELAAIQRGVEDPRAAAQAQATEFEADAPAHALAIKRAAFIPPTETRSGKGDRSFYEALLEFAKKINDRVKSLKGLATKSAKHAKNWHAMTQGVHSSRSNINTSASTSGA